MNNETIKQVTVNFWDIEIDCGCCDVKEEARDIIEKSNIPDEEVFGVFDNLIEKYSSQWKNRYTKKTPSSVTIEVNEEEYDDDSIILEIATDKLSDKIGWCTNNYSYEIIK